MAYEKKTLESLGKSSPGGNDPIAPVHPTDEWLHNWHRFVFPLTNGAQRNDYKPRIEKYIKAWLELVSDIDPNGKKYTLKDFDIVPAGVGAEFKAFANAEEIPSGGAGAHPNTNRTKPTGGGLPEKPSVPSHILPPPPPPPPK